MVRRVTLFVLIALFVVPTFSFGATNPRQDGQFPGWLSCIVAFLRAAQPSTLPAPAPSPPQKAGAMIIVDGVALEDPPEEEPPPTEAGAMIIVDG